MKEEEVQHLRNEFLKTTLSREIKSDVEGSLFRYYRNVGSIIFATLAFVGVAFGWPQIKQIITQEIQAQIHTLADEPVNNATVRAKDAEKIASAISAQLDRENVRLNESSGRIDAKIADIQTKYGAADQKLFSLQETITFLKQNTEFLNSEVQPAKVKPEDVVALDEQIKAVASQVEKLASEIQKLSAENSVGVSTVQANLGKIIIAQSKVSANFCAPSEAHCSDA
jgi:archaellum component FlaC